MCSQLQSAKLIFGFINTLTTGLLYKVKPEYFTVKITALQTFYPCSSKKAFTVNL